MSWKTESIPDFVFFQEGPGLRNWQWTDEGMKVINVKNILGDGVGSVDTTNSDKYISSTEFESKYKHFEVEDRDIVVASSGNTYGKVGRIEQNNLPLMMNTSVIRFRSKDERLLNNEFLYCFLRSPLFKNQIEQFVTGGAQPNFGPTHIKKMAIPVPPLRVQQSIGELVCQYDHLLSNNKRRVELLEESARQLYKEWFVRFRFPGHEHVKIIDGVPEGWNALDLGNVVTVIKNTVQPVNLPEGTPYIGLEHFPRRSFTLNGWESSEKVTSTKYAFKSGDILFGKIRPYFHKVGFTLIDGITSSDAIVLRPNHEKHYSIILSEVSSDRFIALASKTVREGSKMPRADWNVLKKSTILEPPENILDVFNAQISSIVEQCKLLSLQMSNLAKARDILLPKLMNGEIAV